MSQPLRALMEADLGRLIEAVSTEYPPGTAARLEREAPGLKAAIERTEARLGSLYRELLAADATLARWRQTLAELDQLWRLAIQVAEAPEAGESAEPPALAEVA
ncbi:MAG: hypothetical protein HYV61_03500 [Candidatus Rokubacteria bacterium]|nr:hypothetical protein [Candidatus Rokubacteria bacterium]